MKNLTKILISIYVAIMMIAVACKKDEPTPTPPATTPTTTPPVITKSTAKDISKFSFATLNPVVDATIDASTKAITATVPAATDITKLVPTITISDKASVLPATGVAQDFSKEVSYTITAEDGSIQTYSVLISVLKACLLTSRTGTGIKEIYDYDTKSRLTKITNTSGTTVTTTSYTYDSNDYLLTYSSGNYIEKYVYQNEKRITKEVFPVSQPSYLVKYEYDGNGNITKQENLGTGTTYTYGNGKTISVTSKSVIYELNSDGLITKNTFTNGFYSVVKYDGDGQTLSYESFNKDGKKTFYYIFEYSTLKENIGIVYRSQIKGEPVIPNTNGKQVFIVKKFAAFNVNITTGLETKTSEVFYTYNLDNNGKISSYSYKDVDGNINILAYAYQGCN